MPYADAPYYPIIYVRGYAMTTGEQDETAADPFCGFNLGSTVYRAPLDKNKPARKFIFESPVVRLSSDFKYSDVYRDGLDIMDQDWTGTIRPRSVVIYRYYDQASALLGTGKTPTMEHFAKGLSQLILRVRELVCADPDSGMAVEDFRCHLVAHSMGGLVCRAFLQNSELGDDMARRCVDKLFTYATPHNGIDMAGINVPKWLSTFDMANFNRDNMAKYLALPAQLYKDTERVDWLPESVFPSSRAFCMVGSNRGDYEVAMGMSRTFAGHGSDGLVRIENARLSGVDDKGQETAPAACAYAYRAHSGYFGIVNSEEAYQNLVRFLFGDIRVDIFADVESVQLPPELKGKQVNALYLFELLAAPRGMRWFLTRRMAEEDSVATRSLKQLTDPADQSGRHIYLSSAFLANRYRKDPTQGSLAYGVTLNVRVPEYEVDRALWFDGHYEGGYLFQDTMVVELTPPASEGADWTVACDWPGDDRDAVVRHVAHQTLLGGKLALTIPFGSTRAPGIAGTLRFEISAWNV